jgi:ABC-type arginine transport system permease subunit
VVCDSVSTMEFTHYLQPWGRDQSVPRQGSTVTREIPDVLELLLIFEGGTLLVKRENQVVARIEHVPFLSRRMKAIERMLGVTRVRSMD